MGNHRLCELELFRGDKEGIKDQVKVLVNTVLPQAIIYHVVLAVATQSQMNLFRVCGRRPAGAIRIKSTLALMQLLTGCSTFGVLISLPAISG